MSAEQNLVSDTTNLVMFPLTGDALLGIFHLLSINPLLPAGTACQLIWSFHQGNSPLWPLQAGTETSPFHENRGSLSGWDIFSLLVENVMSGFPSSSQSEPFFTCVEDGFHMDFRYKVQKYNGTNKKILREGKDSLYWRFHQVNPLALRLFLEGSARLANAYLGVVRLSVGPTDFQEISMPDLKVRYLENSQRNCAGEGELTFGEVEEAFEGKAEELGPRNSLVAMFLGGSKGKVRDLVAQSTLLLRPQNPESSQKTPKFTPHNFLEGLPPQEYFSQAELERYGTILQGTEVRETVEKDMRKSLMDLTLQYDGTVRMSTQGQVVQFRYSPSLPQEEPLKVQPGDSVGLMAVHAIIKPVSQLTLDLKHGGDLRRDSNELLMKKLKVHLDPLTVL